MDHELPEFQRRAKQKVLPLLNDVFRGQVVELLDYPDGHFRVILKADVFTLQPGENAPTRSQWSTLKKRLKRRDKQIFIFKDSGSLPCPKAAPVQNAEGDDAAPICYYLDFGFFLH